MLSLLERVALITPEMAAFLLTKPRPKLGTTCCSPYHDHEGGCRRPVWGDGRVGGDWFGFCSRCWHVWNAFHGSYVTFKMNPASALNAGSVDRLRFLNNELPPVGAERPDTFPEGWLR